ncbi:MAG: DegV family protein [Acutalibacteraceae bacterium]
MNDYVIMTDSTIDLNADLIEKLHLNVIRMTICIDDKFFSDNELSSKEFYNKLRNKSVSSTSQINPSTFVEYFTDIVQTGKDILYICFSSGLSGMYNSAVLAAEEVMKNYPDRKILVLDSLSASIGEGLLVYNAAMKKCAGADMEEVAEWVEENKLKICHWFMVDDLNHLCRGGRISQSSAFLGSMMNIKPILSVDNDGKLKVAAKVRGKTKAADYILSQIENNAQDVKNQTIFVGHADCEENANFLANAIKDKFNPKEIIISNLGAVIGSHVGPGMFAATFLGNKR